MDWTKVISDLMSAGYTQTRIAKECKCGQATISDLARKINESPNFDLGKALLALHRKARREAKRQAAANSSGMHQLNSQSA